MPHQSYNITTILRSFVFNSLSSFTHKRFSPFSMASLLWLLFLLLFLVLLLLLLFFFRASSSSSNSDSSSSSSTDAPRIKYDVFISFRGEDIRDSFLSHLKKEMLSKQIDFFVDDKNVHPGDQISPTLLQAIGESFISLVIFSKHYASSKWCMEELVKITECMRRYQRIVMPVFYHVEPYQVRHQKGTFAEAFDDHKKKYKVKKAELQKWRSVLKEIANISGNHYPSPKYENESKLIEEIVKEISEKLRDTFSNASQGLIIGIDENFKFLQPLMAIESDEEVRIVGIWGMGGIGKTAIAKTLFAKYASRYQGCCFLHVKEELQKCSQHSLYQKLFSELLGGEYHLVKGSPQARLEYVKRRLNRKKVLVVLDDVDTLDMLDYLTREQIFLAPGSRVIVTTRDQQLLIAARVHEIYKVQGLSFKSSLELFCIKAFNKTYPDIGYEELSQMAVEYADGVPLALQVLGSFLCSRNAEAWRSALTKLETHPDPTIFNVLKLSYDGLDEFERNIFLDIAFFFKGERIGDVTRFLDSCGFFAEIGINNLERKALITISRNNEIEMHDLIEQMGREIVRQESIKDPGKRSRLSNHEEVYNVLNNNKGTDSVEGIMMDLSQIERDLHLDADTFKKMPNIRFLKFYNFWKCNTSAKMYVSSTLESFPNELRYLEWSGCPLKSFPPTLCAEKLVNLSMPDSQVSKLWDGVQDLVNLKKIKLRGCKQLVELPDFTKASNLEEIDLNDCVRLCELHPSMLSIHKLETLNVHGCEKLKSLVGKIHLKSLRTLHVGYCSRLKEFSLSSEELTSLKLNGTIIDTLRSSVGRLRKLREFDLSNLRLETLPDELCLLVSLEILNLEGCKQLIELPHNMKALSRLQELNLEDCFSLRFLPELPASIIHLSATNCTSLEKLFNINTVFSLNLKSFSFENCERLDEHSIFEYVQFTMMGIAIRDILGDMLQYKIEPHADDEDTTFIPESNSQVFYPGSKVPPWFIYQTREASLTIDLPADQPLNQLVGFILCCVVNHIPSQRQKIVLPTTNPFLFPEKPPIISCYGGFGSSKRFAKTTPWSSDHVCIWFTGERRPLCLGNNVTFEFKAQTLYPAYPHAWLDREWGVIACGVYPIYASDILDVFDNVDPQFQFFNDKHSLERELGIGRKTLQSLFTLDQVKTMTIQKMEKNQGEMTYAPPSSRVQVNHHHLVIKVKNIFSKANFLI